MTSSTRLKKFAAILALILIAGTVGFYFAEEMSLVDSLYLTVVTVATVGYGDLHPLTTPGKLMAVILIITGVGTFLAVVAGATELLLERRQEELRREKLRMVIELFITEIGGQLLRFFAGWDPSPPRGLEVSSKWKAQDFRKAQMDLREADCDLDLEKIDFDGVRHFIESKAPTLLRLLENPNLGDDELFTDLLRAVFHLKAELSSRTDLSDLPASDADHLRGDMKRVYRALTVVWLDHLQYLKSSYPFLFSLSARLNPFIESSSPTVR